MPHIKDLIGLFCNLGNQIDGSSHGLDPQTLTNFDFWELSYQRDPAYDVKLGTKSIFNVNTSFQRLKHIHIPYGKTISA
jgi:hypothetical protein